MAKLRRVRYSEVQMGPVWEHFWEDIWYNLQTGECVIRARPEPDEPGYLDYMEEPPSDDPDTFL